ncbi:hypothetical protein ACPCGN_26210 [Methylobacterium sp. NPDC014790]|uniref:hypothetical protein n=1 Tax=Methylobacterium sp. NPDC014790 TaxID=3364153 RepID=UPI003C2C0A4A
MDPASGALLAQTAAGHSVVLGLMRCARIWLCPVCSATIRHKRTEEITEAVVEWIRRGGTAYLVTLTARHDYRDELADLMDAIQGTRASSPAEIRTARREEAEAQDALADATARSRAAVAAARLAAPKGKKRAAMAQARAESAGGIEEAQARLGQARETLARTRRQAGAYQRLISGGTWAGDKREKASEAAAEGIRDRIGYIGMIRSTEVTVGEVNLWHPHIHAIVFVGGRTTGERADQRLVGVFQPSEGAIKEWEDHWRAVWTGHLQRVNPKYRPSDECSIPDCKCDGKGHGVDFKLLRTVRDAQKMGEYLAKTQDGKNPAMELARGDLKEARKGNMTPFQMLFRIGDLTGGVSEEDAPGHGSLVWCLARWHEYERATRGRRAIEWTRYLRTVLGLTGGDTEEDDHDLLAAADAASEFRGGAAVTDKGWAAVTKAGLDLAATEAAEGTDANEDPAALTDRVREVLALAGVPGEVRQLTSKEVADAYAAILESQAQRREEAAARRRREDENEDQEHDADETARRARRAIETQARGRKEVAARRG